MKIYKVVNIEEADYGCEESSCGARALVLLESGDTECKVEMSEDWIAFSGIDTGKTVICCEDGKFRRFVKVAAAVIRKEENGVKKIFATQRGYGEYKDKWEFPGGKVENGETSEQALVREIKEELDTTINVGEKIYTIEYDYPDFHLSMDCFFAELTGGMPVLKEHEAAKWADKESLDLLEWLPADMSLTEKLKTLL